ncbi:hypothetical protein Nepgr_006530 [Nepenthes gracilis]|uniref:Uncharacterized protein n=1 Tax=Nepenthes gracilis TaxID=150966 RepID=A0AAD3S5C1_NEPGR|nr:hypothetical protein Nepgr_006530 [Nepenthes gracilis]
MKVQVLKTGGWAAAKRTTEDGLQSKLVYESEPDEGPQFWGIESSAHISRRLGPGWVGVYQSCYSTQVDHQLQPWGFVVSSFKCPILCANSVPIPLAILPNKITHSKSPACSFGKSMGWHCIHQDGLSEALDEETSSHNEQEFGTPICKSHPDCLMISW